MSTPAWTLFFDGLCEPNPDGRMAWGWVIITPDGEVLSGRDSKPRHPANTNNISEWLALGFGLKALIDVSGDREPANLKIHGDSQLVIYQLIKRCECKAPHLIPYRDRFREILLESKFNWIAEWIPREENHLADEQSRLAYQDAEGRMPPERKKWGSHAK